MKETFEIFNWPEGTDFALTSATAGIVFAMRLYQQWISGVPNGSRMIWGSNRVHDGFVGFIGMAVLIAVAYWAPLPSRLVGAAPLPESLEPRSA